MSQSQSEKKIYFSNEATSASFATLHPRIPITVTKCILEFLKEKVTSHSFILPSNYFRKS
jgi:hypothetical protein